MLKPKKTQELPNYVAGLQALRGVAVLLVVASHLHTIVSTDPHFIDVTPLPWINQALSRGFLGVDIFFVLSGFLITSLLFKEGEKGIIGKDGIGSLGDSYFEIIHFDQLNFSEFYCFFAFFLL